MANIQINQLSDAMAWTDGPNLLDTAVFPIDAISSYQDQESDPPQLCSKYVTSKLGLGPIRNIILDEEYLAGIIERIYAKTLPNLVYSNTLMKFDIAEKRDITLSTLFLDDPECSYYVRFMFANRGKYLRVPSVFIQTDTGFETDAISVDPYQTRSYDITLDYGKGISVDNTANDLDMTMLVYKNSFPAGMTQRAVDIKPNTEWTAQADGVITYDCSKIPVGFSQSCEVETGTARSTGQTAKIASGWIYEWAKIRKYNVTSYSDGYVELVRKTATGEERVALGVGYVECPVQAGETYMLKIRYSRYTSTTGKRDQWHVWKYGNGQIYQDWRFQKVVDEG